MINVEKQVKVTIEGEDVQSLSDVCELARRWLGKDISKGEYNLTQTHTIKQFINEIFDAGLT